MLADHKCKLKLELGLELKLELKNTGPGKVISEKNIPETPL